jgi:hypothetical protein
MKRKKSTQWDTQQWILLKLAIKEITLSWYLELEELFHIFKISINIVQSGPQNSI